MTTTISYMFGDYPVSLAHSADDPLGPLDDLHICHLGMKFLSTRPLTEFTQFEFAMRLPPEPNAPPEAFNCHGVVVSSTPEDGSFRTVIHFCNLTESAARRIEQITRDHHMRCNDCENG